MIETIFIVTKQVFIMKNILLLLAMCISLLGNQSCGDTATTAQLKKENDSLKILLASKSITNSNTAMNAPNRQVTSVASARYTTPISKAEAKDMIDWYLNGTQHLINDDDIVRSFYFDYPTIETYLKGTGCKNLQLILARTSSGGPFTLILAGVKKDGSHIYTANNEVYEHCFPCPSNCLSTDNIYVDN